MPVNTIEWIGGVDGFVRLIDQTRLPGELKYLDCRDVDTIWEAIKALRVRGAPAIGIAAAMGVVLGTQKSSAKNGAAFVAKTLSVADYLATSRPTAVNLFWALDRMREVAKRNESLAPEAIHKSLLDEALVILEEDRDICRRIGVNGADLIKDGAAVLTHCNAGGLATAQYGTALAAIYAAHEQGKHIRVYADETRPLLQGARLTTWELMQAGIDVTLICDNTAGFVMKQKKIDLAIVGADRIARNGDTANKIGTYSVAVLAQKHKIPFYIAAPASTFDLSIASGEQIPIEERSGDEITCFSGMRMAPEGVKTYSPAFDVTPAELITGIITEYGIISPPNEKNVTEHFRPHQKRGKK